MGGRTLARKAAEAAATCHPRRRDPHRGSPTTRATCALLAAVSGPGPGTRRGPGARGFAHTHRIRRVNAPLACFGILFPLHKARRGPARGTLPHNWQSPDGVGFANPKVYGMVSRILGRAPTRGPPTRQPHSRCLRGRSAPPARGPAARCRGPVGCGPRGPLQDKGQMRAPAWPKQARGGGLATRRRDGARPPDPCGGTLSQEASRKGATPHETKGSANPPRWGGEADPMMQQGPRERRGPPRASAADDPEGGHTPVRTGVSSRLAAQTAGTTPPPHPVGVL